MSVEIVGFIIIILAMLVVIVRRQMMKNRVNVQKNLDDSANQLQFQLEEVADTVIKRVGKEIDHLEVLLQEADQKISEIDDKIKYLEEMTAKQNHRAVQLPIPHEETKPIYRGLGKNMLGSGSAAIPERKNIRKNDVKYSKINTMVMEMLDSGYTLDEIAKQAKIGKGAVLLIKEMYKLQKSEEKE